MERRNYFSPMVYSAYGIPETEAIAAEKRLALLLINNQNREYSEMCGFIRAGISLAIVKFSTLILQGSRDNESYIFQIPDLVDGAVMALLVPWRG